MIAVTGLTQVIDTKSNTLLHKTKKLIDYATNLS